MKLKPDMSSLEAMRTKMGAPMSDWKLPKSTTSPRAKATNTSKANSKSPKPSASQSQRGKE